LNQLNQLLHKMIQCFKELETAHAGETIGQNSVNATQTQAKCFIESKIYQMQLTNHLIRLKVSVQYSMCSFISF